MLSLHSRSIQKELLDGDSIPNEDIIQNMKELDTINTLLGGHAITLSGFKQLLNKRTNITVMEIGCGGGDNLRVIYQFCQKHHINVQCIGVELNEDTAQYAQAKNPWLQVVCADYRNIDTDIRPDIIFSSLFCHHFSHQELVTQIQWMHSRSTVGFFINDLHRHWMAYYSIKLLTMLFSSSYLVKHDAPLSVARSFTKEDWLAIFSEAQIASFRIKWKWAFRFLIIASV